MTDWINEIHLGDCRALMRRMIADGVRVQCVVTSPPYFGLRDYGVTGQFGMEASPQDHIENLRATFHLMRDLLNPDGVFWLNYGDSYASSGGSGFQGQTGARQGRRDVNMPKKGRTARWGYKPKDLMGLAWRTAFALQEDQYSGLIRNEADRAWLAAMIDGEGCFYVHKRKAGQHAGDGYRRKTDTYSCAIQVCNTNRDIVERCKEICGGKGSIYTKKQNGTRGRMPLHAWTLRSKQARAVAAEIYPYLVAKKQQCRIIGGIPFSGDAAEIGFKAMKDLHAGLESGVDFPEPKSLYSPGWYLRSSVIWSKLNPMPESAKDRPTTAHEYLFLMSKRRSYYYDHVAVREPASSNSHPRRAAAAVTGWDHGPGAHSTMRHASDRDTEKESAGLRDVQKFKPRIPKAENMEDSLNELQEDRSMRTVWTFASEAFKGAHFATFPRALVERCILAGSKPGDIIFDPFAGTGTVAEVALSLGRQFIGCEISAKYIKMFKRFRSQQMGLAL